MFNNIGVILLTLIEAIGTYINAYLGAQRFFEYSDKTLADSKYDRVPHVLIRKHFNLPKKQIHIITYIRYILTYYLFVRMLLLPILAFALSWNLFYYFVIYFLSFFLLCVPTLAIVFVQGMTECKNKNRTLKVRKNIKQVFREEVERIIIQIRCMKHFRKKEYHLSLQKELSKCSKKQKGFLYFPLENISYFKKNILPKYQKHVYYEILNDEYKKSMFFVYDKSDNEVIFQAEIKKE